MAAYGQLLFGKDHPELHTPSPFSALATLQEKGLLPIDTQTLEDYAWLRRVAMRIRLLRDDDDCEEWLPEVGDRVLARTLDMDNDTVLKATRDAMSRMRAAYNRVFI